MARNEGGQAPQTGSDRPGGAPLPRSVVQSVRRWSPGVKEFNTLLASVALGTYLAITAPVFLTSGNLFGVARAFSLTAIAAIGQTPVIITGGIVLSVGSVLALSALSTGMLLNEG